MRFCHFHVQEKLPTILCGHTTAHPMFSRTQKLGFYLLNNLTPVNAKKREAKMALSSIGNETHLFKPMPLMVPFAKPVSKQAVFETQMVISGVEVNISMHQQVCLKCTSSYV
jgi:hypothetical protein